MRNVFVFLTGLLLSGGLAPAAWADTPAVTSATTTQKARLDKLFVDLKRERNDKVAERIAGNLNPGAP
jgi:hypothetical protein